MTGNIPLYTGTGGTPAEGHMRYNATDNIPEFYDGAAWQSADCPVLIDFTTNSISDSASIQTPTIASGTVYTKMLIKWLHVTTTSTNWDLWIYTTAAGANEFQIVNDRSGNYSIYLDYPYADGSGTTNIYVKYIDNAAAAACTIRCLAMKMR